MSSIFTYHKIDDAQFNKLADDIAPQHIPIEQTPYWGAFDDSIKGRQFLGSYRYDDDGQLVALASATLYRQKGRDWIWIKHGPIFVTEANTQTLKKMCSTLKAQFSSVDGTKPVFIRLSSTTKTKPLVLPFEHTMYDETVMIDLTQSEDEVLAGMSQGGRRSVRKAQKEDLVVSEYSGAEAVSIFKNECYKILKETSERDKFGIHPESLYTGMLEGLSENAKLYTISHQNRVIAWAITTEYSKQALYYYGGSNILARELHAPYLLHWEVMKKMKERGNKTYDFMGIAGSNYPELASVTTFKLKFSKEIVKVNQAYDLPLQPTKYKLLSLAIKAKRKIR